MVFAFRVLGKFVPTIIYLVDKNNKLYVILHVLTVFVMIIIHKVHSCVYMYNVHTCV